MSVMACDRYGCDNVMCDRMILERSLYICERCYKELKGTIASWPEVMTKSDFNERVREFMDSAPRPDETLLTREELADSLETGALA